MAVDRWQELAAQGSSCTQSTQLLEANQFYRFSSLPSDIFLFVARSKAALGWEKVAADQARSRHIAIPWFETLCVHGNSVNVRPIEGGAGQLISYVLGIIRPSM